MTGKTKDLYPMMEYVGTRRVKAAPMSRRSAIKRNIPGADIPGTNKREAGFHVKEPLGKDHWVEYWLPENTFLPNHVKTDQYTIGEIAMLLHQGMQVRRPFWPANEWIEFREGEQVKDYNEGDATHMAPFIAKMQVFKDPLGENKSELVISHWIPMPDDLFAKDFQAIKLNFNPVTDEDKKKTP